MWARSSTARERALILIRGYWAFGMVFVSCAVGMRGIAPDERRGLRRVVTISVVASVLAMTCLPILFFPRLPLATESDPVLLAEVRRINWLLRADLAALFLPLAIAFGLVCGIAGGFKRHATPAASRVVLAVGVASCLVIFALTNWMLPSGLQAVRTITHEPHNGIGEETLGQLRLQLAAIEGTKTAGQGTIRGAEVQYHLRWSWPFAAMALGLFALSLNHRGRAVRVGLPVASCAIYFYLVRHFVTDLVWTSHLPPIFLAWLPDLVFVALSIVAMMVSRPPASKVV